MKPDYPRRLRERIDPQWEHFSWLTLRALVSSANDVVAPGAGSLVNERRQRWVAAQRAAGILEEFDELVVSLDKEPRSFIVIGDTGEADESQYAVVAPLLKEAEKSEVQFMLIASDVVYPAGNVNDYLNALYIPYREFVPPIYAIPGNHDWYDGLEGFMFNFCGAEPLPSLDVDPASYSIRERFWRAAWRRAAAAKRDALIYYRNQRLPWSEDPFASHQPGPYFALDLGKLLVVCIDTGVTGDLDAEQGEWLRRISKRDQPKLLVTGKPLYVDNERRPGPISDYVPPPNAPPKSTQHRSVDEVVRHPAHRYIAAIGGDIHNYQRYEDRAGQGPPLTYLVSGGGGAYLGSTHEISIQKHGAFPNDTFAKITYPSPAQSLQVYAERLVPEVWRTVLLLLFAFAGGILGCFLLGAGWVSDSLEVALAAVGVVLVAAMLVRRIWHRNRHRRQRALSIAAFGAGVGVPLLARLVTDGHRWISFKGLGPGLATVGLMLIPVAVAVGAALLAREYGDDLPRKVVTIAWLLAPISAFAVACWMLSRETDGYVVPLLWCAGLVLLIGLGYGIDKWLGKERSQSRAWVRWAERIRGPFLFFVAAAWIALFITLWSRHEQAALALLITFAAVAHVPVFLGFAYYMNRISSNATFWVALVYGLFLAGVVALTVIIGSEWVLRYLGGLVCIAVIVLALTLGAYMYWIRGFALLRHLDARTGVLDPQEPGSHRRPTIEADAFLAWNEACRPRQHSLTKRVHAIGTIVYPSRRKDVRSPLHHALSEIFEPQQPPMYKSFLRVDVEDDEVKITCFGVEGFDDEATVVDTIHLALPS